MSSISTDRIVPRIAAATAIDALSIGGGSILANYERIPFEVTSTAAGIDGSIPATGVIVRLGDDITLYMNPFTFTPTVAPSDPEALYFSGGIPVAYRPLNESVKFSKVMLAYSARPDPQPVDLTIDANGEVTFTPIEPVSTGGWCTTDGTVYLPGCSISWPINLPAYVM